MGGFLVALTSFLTTYATSKKQALQHGYHIDASLALRGLSSKEARRASLSFCNKAGKTLHKSSA